MINEVRYALRMLLMGPGFTAAAVLSLALGIGAHTPDPATFIAIAVLLGAVAFLACYLHARRAAKLDPMIALARN